MSPILTVCQEDRRTTRGARCPSLAPANRAVSVARNEASKKRRRENIVPLKAQILLQEKLEATQHSDLARDFPQNKAELSHHFHSIKPLVYLRNGIHKL